MTDEERARIRAYAARIVADAPPPTAEQRERLTMLIRPAVLAVRRARRTRRRAA